MSSVRITTRYGSRTAAGGGGGVSGGGGAGGGVDNFSKYFEVVNEGTAEELIKAKFPLHSINDIVAFSNGTGGGTAPTIPLATYATVGVVKVDPSTMTVDAEGMIAVKGDLFNLSNYYDKAASDGRFAAIAHRHLFSDIDGKPTTLGGYGITDAIKNTGGTIAGDLTITGNLYLQQDGKYIVTEKVYSENDFITLRYNNPSLLAAGAYTGFEAKKVFADGTDGYLVFGSDGMARVGKQASLQMLATREDAPMDAGVAVWSAANKRFNSVAASSLSVGDSAKLGGRAAGDFWHKDNINRSDTDFVAYNVNANSLTVHRDINGQSSDYNDKMRFRRTDVYGYIDIIESVADAAAGYGGLIVTSNGIRAKGADKIRFSVDDPSGSLIRLMGNGNCMFYGNAQSSNYSGSGITATGWGITIDGDANVKNCIVRNDLSVKKTKLFGPDDTVKWTAQVSAAGDYLEFYNASGVLEMRLSQAGKIQVRDDVEAFSNFN